MLAGFGDVLEDPAHQFLGSQLQGSPLGRIAVIVFVGQADRSVPQTAQASVAHTAALEIAAEIRDHPTAMLVARHHHHMMLLAAQPVQQVQPLLSAALRRQHQAPGADLPNQPRPQLASELCAEGRGGKQPAIGTGPPATVLIDAAGTYQKMRVRMNPERLTPGVPSFQNCPGQNADPNCGTLPRLFEAMVRYFFCISRAP